MLRTRGYGAAFVIASLIGTITFGLPIFVGLRYLLLMIFDRTWPKLESSHNGFITEIIENVVSIESALSVHPTGAEPTYIGHSFDFACSSREVCENGASRESLSAVGCGLNCLLFLCPLIFSDMLFVLGCVSMIFDIRRFQSWVINFPLKSMMINENILIACRSVPFQP